jgi:pimeloyl-ACP methyl ester carboxylesterase
MSTPHLVFIHGANQSDRSWNYIIDKLAPENYTAINYSSQTPFFENLRTITAELSGLTNIFFISHSLGGIYAVHLYDTLKQNVLGGVSISTPYHGSRTADFIKYMIPTYSLFREIGPYSPPISLSNDINISVPWAQVVTTRGSVPWHCGRNDGVVTYDSMTYRSDVSYFEVAENHYEVLASPETVKIILDRLGRI